ncbi:hypothetical protein GUG53_01040, partial [Xanthomonas citri pv. citri]|nr:hypothetical protein [Xanthomonas citri pv. citri]
HPVDCPFLVMELVSGRTLREILHAEGAVGPDRAVAWTRGVLEALEHAHEEGIVALHERGCSRLSASVAG